MAKIWTKVKISASTLRSEQIFLQPNDKLTGEAFIGWTGSVTSRALSIEIWDLSELRLQSKSIPNNEAILDSALLYKKRGFVESDFKFGADIIAKAASNAGITKSVRVVSILAQATDTIDVEVWVEIDRL